ncbi:heparan-alpha-glucosaminide N-acetyltransferase domain-containing protein [soil metagenome]
MSGSAVNRDRRDLHPTQRQPAPDVIRAIALFGVILMNYHGYLVIRGAPRRDGALSELLDPWTGVFSTRFAATFVLVAGVGVTLMTRSAIGAPARVRTLRWRLASRGMVLYAFGLAFDIIWPGAILPFSGEMFAVAALLFTLRTRWLVVVGAAAALAGWAIAWWRLEREIDARSTAWLTDPGARSVRGLVFDVMVNGTHPLLPWLAFFCAGMVVGRIAGTAGASRDVIGTGVALFGFAVVGRWLLWDGADTRARVLFSTEPFDRGLLYVVSALGTALVAYGVISWLVDRLVDVPVVDGLRRAGQLSLTIYVLHALVFNLLVDTLGFIDQGDVFAALLLAVLVWGVATVAAAAWQPRHERGPLEQVYRSITR